MGKEIRYEFTVKGRDLFPIDMLRYDCCWPKTETNDSYNIAASYERGNRAMREVTLIGLKDPTVGRWHSFGWEVTETQKRILV